MDYRLLTFTLLVFICSVIAVDILSESSVGSNTNQEVSNTAKPQTDDERQPEPHHRQKRHDIEIHRVIKRRPKPPPSQFRGRKPRPPRRPSKPKVKYGPPNVHYPPLSHYTPQGYDDSFSNSYDDSDHNSFAEPPVSYGNPIHPSPAFGSPHFAYGQGTTSYQGSSYGKPSYGGQANFEDFDKHSFSLSNLDGIDAAKLLSYLGNASGKLPGGLKATTLINGKQTSYHPSSLFTKDEPNYYPHKDSSGYTRLTEADHPKHQFPLEGYKQDPYKTPLTSYEVPLTRKKPNLFEPSKEYDSSFKNMPASHVTSSITSTHTSSHSTIDDDEEEYIPNLPNRYEQEQFHNPSQPNPNKPLTSSIQPITDNDPFTNLNYDEVSESQKISVKTRGKHADTSSGDNYSVDYPHVTPTGKRNKIRRKKKPKPTVAPASHNLDTDDLRDAYGSSSDFHEIAIDADEFLEFEPQKQIKHSRPRGVTMIRSEDNSPTNFVLLSSQNKVKETRSPSYRITTTTAYPKKTPSDSEFKTVDITFYKSVEPKPKVPKPLIGLDDINILSIQKSNSKSYYAGDEGKEAMLYQGFMPTRRNGAQQSFRMDYEMLDDDENENYDDISDVGTFGGKLLNGRIKKDLTNKTDSVNRKTPRTKYS
ncbi:uncharacterized protein LOC129779743 [Toxorhynchites rutilus septentrionalis]|uniref:uncharacterized protein LOC129779743 n=1 Tax=Toxorhynchites rutilus septentrionalis TaxID=329112 RepID=UPI002479E89E|nr:uncharacterized protein LOC129779743 [Toxorhynchites rutilus septentrionalis]